MNWLMTYLMTDFTLSAQVNTEACTHLAWSTLICHRMQAFLSHKPMLVQGASEQW